MRAKNHSRLTDVCDAINAHLRKLEADPAYNVRQSYDSKTKQWYTPENKLEGSHKLYNASCYRAGSVAVVVYIAYQGSTTLNRAAADRYLAWLEAGNKGKHWEVR